MRRNSMGKYTDLVRQLGLTQAQITATLALREDVLRRLERHIPTSSQRAFKLALNCPPYMLMNHQVRITCNPTCAVRS